MAKKILITGGTGFVGYHLTEALLAQGNDDIHITSTSDGKRFAWYEQIGGQSHVHQVNLNESEPILDLLNELQPDEIYHLASIAQVGNSFTQARNVLENNFNLQLNLLEAISIATPKVKLLAISSAAIYQVTPTKAGQATKAISEKNLIEANNPYAASKAIQDIMAIAYAKSRNLNIKVARPFNHIGDGQGPGFAVPDFTKQIAIADKNGGGIIKVGNLTPKRDFTDVKDVVQAYILIMEKGIAGEVYNIGSGHSISMNEILKKLISFAKNSELIKVEIDEQLLRPVEVMDVIADNVKVSKLGWKTTYTIDQTLSRIYQYWQDQVNK